MRTRQVLLAIPLIFMASGFAKSQQLTNSVDMDINFNARTCWENNFGNVCTIGMNQYSTKTIALEALPNNPNCGSTTVPPVPPSESEGTTPPPQSKEIVLPSIDFLQSGTQDSKNLINQCETRAWRGHWIDLLYNNGKRFIGVVTVEKSLVSLSSEPSQDRTWYRVTVEIMDMKKTVAKMNTDFEFWDQLPSASLESMPIDDGSATTTITLNISKALYLIISPAPSPLPLPGNPVASPTPSKLLHGHLPQSVWNVTIGQLSNKP